MITKTLLKNEEIPQMIRKCYESDVEHILKVHVTGDKGLEFCINQTIVDLILNNVKVYVIYDNNEFVAYFGEELVNNDKYLTGFFIAPEKRKTHKNAFWKEVVKHFNKNFKVNIYNKNEPARNFLVKNGCKLNNSNEIGLFFEYKECI